MSDDNAKGMALLKNAWAENNLVLFLGAGTSVPRGLPSWESLTVDLVASSATKLVDFWSNYRRAAGAWMAEALDLTPVSLSRIYKMSIAETREWQDSDRKKYLNAIRDLLYANGSTPPSAPNRDTLSALVDLLCVSERSHTRKIQTVITTNFDDLLERELATKDILCDPVYTDSPQKNGGRLRIVHAHGYIPSTLPVPIHDIVFAEDEYHELTYNMFHWAVVELVHLLRTATVFFVGFSLTDPNIRRLLDATRRHGNTVAHVAIRRRIEFDATELSNVADEIAKRAAKLDPVHKKESHDVAEVVQAAVRQARRYDQQLLERMGVS